MVAAAVFGLLVGYSGVPAAGVVMSETSSIDGPIGTQAEHRTIYVQGNKQKVETEGVATITDLDKHQLYIVDTDHKNYVEMPLGPLNGQLDDSGAASTGEIVLKRTGKTHLVAAQRCDEYRGRKEAETVKIAVRACVSKATAGAREITRFDNEMISQLAGSKIKTDQESAAVLLEKESVVNFRVPDPSPQGFRTASLVTKVRVNDITLRQLPAQTFIPPKGYTRVEGEPPLSAHDDAQSIALMQTRSPMDAFGSRAHSKT
jgi:hypothetical protein